MAQKTNVCRILDSANVPYKTYEYSVEDGQIDGESVAAKVGQPSFRVFKTLVTRAASGRYCVFVLPVCCELDLKSAARACGEKSVEMIKVADITKITGYVRGGCSPIGMKKLFATIIDERATKMQNIVISAGKIGMQVDLPVLQLAEISHAEFAPISVVCSNV